MLVLRHMPRAVDAANADAAIRYADDAVDACRCRFCSRRCYRCHAAFIIS